ncbi:MAG TPA: phosphotransferase family protein [Aestuariivirgaceae bacterium]
MIGAADRQTMFAGTRSIAPALAFDIAALETYLAANLPGYSGSLRVEQFKGGQSNPTYLLCAGHQRYVLRRKPPGKLLPSAHAIEREYRVTRALHGIGFPVPRPLLLSEDPSIIGTAFYVMDHVHGRIFWEPHAPGLGAPERNELFDSLNETIARLHMINFDALGLSGFGKPDGYVARQIKRWSDQYRASQTRAIDAMERLMAWLPQAVPKQAEAALIHGDFRVDNCIIDARAPRVIAVLDWELSTIGDPLADFTYQLMQWHMPVDARGGGVGSLVGRQQEAPGLPSMESYVARYCERRGLSGIPNLNMYLAYNFFRLAAIFQGIAGRVRDGTAANPHADLMARQVEPMAAKAWEFAMEAGE